MVITFRRRGCKHLVAGSSRMVSIANERFRSGQKHIFTRGVIKLRGSAAVYLTVHYPHEHDQSVPQYKTLSPRLSLSLPLILVLKMLNTIPTWALEVLRYPRGAERMKHEFALGPKYCRGNFQQHHPGLFSLSVLSLEARQK